MNKHSEWSQARASLQACSERFPPRFSLPSSQVRPHCIVPIPIGRDSVIPPPSGEPPRVTAGVAKTPLALPLGLRCQSAACRRFPRLSLASSGSSACNAGVVMAGHRTGVDDSGSSVRRFSRPYVLQHSRTSISLFVCPVVPSPRRSAVHGNPVVGAESWPRRVIYNANPPATQTRLDSDRRQPRPSWWLASQQQHAGGAADRPQVLYPLSRARVSYPRMSIRVMDSTSTNTGVTYRARTTSTLRHLYSCGLFGDTIGC